MEKTYTLDELSAYDGKENRAAYLAIDGIVYDVTNFPAWAGGSHHKQLAGRDLTDAIKTISPHGTAVLEAHHVPIVGKLVKD
ncbi:MAG: cytochrome B5 [Streptococcaceae bacterium]|jgi:predicted heme/steroid binding protein|nr:cytochrome B5 [Streptococcaceae bacterium]